MATSPFRNRVAATVFVLTTALLPAAIRADDTARITSLESAVQKLRTQLSEQDRRIQRLEAELARRGSATPDLPTSQPVERASVESPQISGSQPWHSPDAWDRISEGMSQVEVTKILGEPTAVEAVDGYKTLFYREGIAGGGSIGGHVNMREDRVVAVKKPESR
jgi:hypothetical protein